MPWVGPSGAATNEPTAVGKDVYWSDFSKSEIVIFHLHYREKLWKRPENDQSARRDRDHRLDQHQRRAEARPGDLGHRTRLQHLHRGGEPQRAQDVAGTPTR